MITKSEGAIHFQKRPMILHRIFAISLALGSFRVFFEYCILQDFHGIIGILVIYMGVSNLEFLVYYKLTYAIFLSILLGYSLAMFTSK